MVEYSIKLIILGEFFAFLGLFRMIRGLAATLLSWRLLTHLFESKDYFSA